MKSQGTRKKTGLASGLTVAALAALTSEERERMGVKSAAWQLAAQLVALLSPSPPAWLGDAEAEHALAAEEELPFLRVASWNIRASLPVHDVPRCLARKAASLAALLGDLTFGNPAVLALQECPGEGVGDDPQRPALAGAFATALGAGWVYTQALTGKEAAGFLYDSSRVEPAGLDAPQTYSGPGWPSPEGESRVPRPPVLALFRIRRGPPALIALLSVHLKSEESGDCRVARLQLRALARVVLPWAEALAQAAAGQSPVTFLILGDFNLHGPADELMAAERTSPGCEWAGLVAAQFSPLLDPDSPSNTGPPVSAADYSYDHVWARGVHRHQSRAQVQRPRELLAQLHELDDARALLSSMADAEQLSRSGAARDPLVAELATEAAKWLKDFVRRGVNNAWSDHWPVVAELYPPGMAQ